MVAHLRCVFGLRRVMTLHLVRNLKLKRVIMSVRTNWLFSVHKIICIWLGFSLQSLDSTLAKRPDPKKSNGLSL